MSNAQYAVARLTCPANRLLAFSLIPVMVFSTSLGSASQDVIGSESDPPDTRSLAVEKGDTAGVVEASPTARTIVVDGGKLSVAIREMPLREAIDEVSRQADIEIRFIGEPPEAGLSMQFSDYPLEKGLRALLGEFDTVFVYAGFGEVGNRQGPITRVFVLPKGSDSDPAIDSANITDTVPAISAQIRDDIVRKSRAGDGDDPGKATDAGQAGMSLFGDLLKLRKRPDADTSDSTTDPAATPFLEELFESVGGVEQRGGANTGRSTTEIIADPVVKSIAESLRNQFSKGIQGTNDDPP